MMVTIATIIETGQRGGILHAWKDEGRVESSGGGVLRAACTTGKRGRLVGLMFVLLCIPSSSTAQFSFTKCKAPDEIEKKLSSHPSAEAYNQLGAYFGKEDRYDCAVAAFRAALQLDSKSWQTHSYLGMAL